MSRTTEYWELKQQLAQVPEALDGTAERARQRARRHRIEKRFGISIGSLAGICAAFVIAVNVLPTFALACGKVPILRELAAAVAFSPSLSAAVEHDYVQYVGQSQTVGDVTVSVEYVIADERRMVVFYRTEGDGAEDWLSWDLLNPDGTPLDGYAITSVTSGDLKRLEVYFTDRTIPQELLLELSVESAPDAAGRFHLRLDPDKTASVVTVPVDTWVEVDGQRLLVDRLELSPTTTTVYLGHDPDNTAWLQSLDFHFTDGEEVYESGDGMLTASGEQDNPGFYTYYFQSFYFLEDPSDLTLWIDGAVWLDKSEPTVTVNLTDGTWTGDTPEGIRNVTVSRSGGEILLTVETADVNRSPFDHTYRDAGGRERSFSGFTMSEPWTDDGVFHPRQYTFHLPIDVGETVEIRLDYTDITQLDTPLEIPIP